MTLTSPPVRSAWPLRLLWVAWLFVLSLGCGTAVDRPPPDEETKPSSAARGFSLRDIGGSEHHPFASPAVKAVTLIFVLADCPIANGYAPEINRLCGEYGQRGVRFFLVQVDSDLTREQASQHAREYGYLCPVVLDRRHVLVARAGASLVPEAAVFAPDGERRYRGRIDDRYVDLGKRRSRVTSRDLRDALDCVLANRPVPRSVTRAVGCFIPRRSPEGPQP